MQRMLRQDILPIAEDKRDNPHYLAEYPDQFIRLATRLVSSLPKSLSYRRTQTQQQNLVSKAKVWPPPSLGETLPLDRAVVWGKTEPRPLLLRVP
jgi:hypothetical protein